jgi:hypothetical protein
MLGPGVLATGARQGALSSNVVAGTTSPSRLLRLWRRA